MKKTIMPLVICAAIGFPASAEDNEGLSLNISAGGEYDSNITVSELDTTTNVGDWAALLDFSAGYKVKSDAKTSFEFGYDFSQSLYSSEGDFNLQSHAITANADTEMNGFDLGLAYGFYSNSLGGDKFLDMHSISPSAAIFFGEGSYVRADYTYYKKSFTVLDDRDANTHSFGASLYQFMDGGDYFTFGLRYEKENTFSDEFDYKGWVAKAGFQSKFDIGSDEAKLSLTVEYKDRNYENKTLSIGEKRDDKRTTFRAKMTYPIFGAFSLMPEYRYVKASSNLASADYNEHVIGATLGYSF